MRREFEPTNVQQLLELLLHLDLLQGFHQRFRDVRSNIEKNKILTNLLIVLWSWSILLSDTLLVKDLFKFNSKANWINVSSAKKLIGWVEC